MDNDVRYKIPKELPTDTISDYYDLLDTIYKDIDKEENYDFARLIQKINKSSRAKPREQDSGAGARRRLEKEIAVYHSVEYILDSEDEDDVYFERERELRQRVMVTYTEAEEEKRKMDEEHARIKSNKQKEMLLKKLSDKRKPVVLTDDGKEKKGKEDRKGKSEKSEQEGMEDDEQDVDKPLPKTASDVEDSDDSDQEKTKQPIRKSTIDKTINLESEDDSTSKKKLQVAPPPRPSPASQRYSNLRRVVRLDSDDSDTDTKVDKEGKHDGQDKQDGVVIDDAGDDNDDDEEATQLLSLTQRLSQTSSKRRIILDDSDDEDTMESDRRSPGSDDRPAKRRIAMDEE